MLHIAVVDDETIICEQLSELLKKYQYAHKMMFQVSTYHTGENLLADMDDEMIFDLIFLDIELAKINGVQVGTYIRNIQKNELCQIIYVSSKTAYALELFKIRPFDFLVKPVSEAVLFECIDKYFELFSKQTCFEYTNKKIRKMIPINSILYFESQGRKIQIHCVNDQKYEYYVKLADITD
ncbi:MAG: response regulator transcription factor, partial [Oscillospiraceae bacterium]|nr:response regulator transcription factor [Oscillospiraceae bacterium]